MERDFSSEKWYNSSERREWYRQYSSPAEGAAVPAVRAKTPPKKRTGMKVTMIVLCVLILIAASAVAFSDRPTVLPEYSGPALPDESASPSADESDGSGDYFDNYHDFFSGYFTADTVEGSRIQRGENVSGVALALSSCRGLEELTLQQIYERSIDSVVGITATESGYDGYYWGTGIIMTENGYILTNAHVISGTDAALVTLSDGRELEALLIGEDTQSDLAVLKIDAEGLKAASFGLSDELSVGDEVVAIGNPLGSQLSGTMTNGIVSAINRGIISGGHSMTLIQTNAALNEGNSGGPLFNMYGQVIGITNMKMSAGYADVTIEGIGFAIPSSNAKDIVDQLISAGKITGRPGIGVTVGAIPASAAARWDLPYGLYVSVVAENSDAYAKGLRPGDIITAVNGQEVYTTDDINIIKDGFGVGEELVFSVFREGERFDVSVALMDMNELYN